MTALHPPVTGTGGIIGLGMYLHHYWRMYGRLGLTTHLFGMVYTSLLKLLCNIIKTLFSENRKL